MRRYIKQVLLGVIFLFVLGICVQTGSENVIAADSDWYLDYNYTLEEKSDYCDDNYIMLFMYTKKANQL